MTTRVWVPIFVALVAACAKSPSPTDKSLETVDIRGRNADFNASLALKEKADADNGDQTASIAFGEELARCAAAFGVCSTKLSQDGQYGTRSIAFGELAAVANKTAVAYALQGGQTPETVAALVMAHRNNLYNYLEWGSLTVEDFKYDYVRSCSKILLTLPYDKTKVPPSFDNWGCLEDTELGQSASGSGYDYHIAEIAAQEAVRAALKDPESARFGQFTRVGNKACLTVNARNAMGGYTGDQQAVVQRIDNRWLFLDTFEFSHAYCVENLL